MIDKAKAIGPVGAATGEFVEPEADAPFVVDRNDPDQQALAAVIGWKRLEEIAKVDAQDTDLQRSPFSQKQEKPSEPEIKPRQTRSGR